MNPLSISRMDQKIFCCSDFGILRELRMDDGVSQIFHQLIFVISERSFVFVVNITGFPSIFFSGAPWMVNISPEDDPMGSMKIGCDIYLIISYTSTHRL